MISKITSIGFISLVSVVLQAQDPCAGKVAYCSDHTGFRAFPNADSCNYYSDSAGLEVAPYCSIAEGGDDDTNHCAGQVAYCSDRTGLRAFPNADSCNYYSDSAGLEVAPYCSK